MKRYRMTLTALTVSGALAVAAAPAAFAQPTTSEAEQTTSAAPQSTEAEQTTSVEPTATETQQSTSVEQSTDVEPTVTETTQTTADAEKETDEDVSSNIANVAGILLPASLVIGGVSWYLNQDGETYVADRGRTTVAPSPEEKETSEQMLNGNAAEVIEQAIAAQEGDGTPAQAATGDQAGAGGQVGAADADSPAVAQETAVAQRGMAAETGNNTVPRALVALAVLALLGAAVPALRRRLG